MDQDREIKREARRQYFKYFRFWMIGAAAVLVIGIFVNAARLVANNRPRGNPEAPKERVYDNADVLTDEEEQRLREHIAKLEKKAHVDLILVTINEPVGADDYTWEDTMMNIADDFYDNNAYGWDQAYGDGALLLANWYEDEDGSQKGSWLSTSGKMENIIGAYEEGNVFDRMDLYIDSDPCRAYQAALSRLAEYGDTSSSAGDGGIGVLGAMAVSAVIAVIYALVNLRQSKAKDTTTASTYVPEGNFIMNSKSDIFLRKSVRSYRIQSSSGGGGSRSHSGGGSYGSHRSSSGHSHGGGGRRR